MTDHNNQQQTETRTKWWAACDNEDCGATIVVEPHIGAPRDVPDPDEWEGGSYCPVCDHWLGWNADEVTR